MARQARSEVFSPDEIAIVHVTSRVVRRCFLLGTDDYTGKNYDHRRDWVEGLLDKFAAQFGMDLLTFGIMQNHLHLVLRSRPDIVIGWSNTTVARRWLQLCPVGKKKDDAPQEPTQAEINSIVNDKVKLAAIRLRLSDISWWMRLLCQRIAQWANREENEDGRFWAGRFKATRLIDATSVLACAAYVDLNPIRAAMAETLESSDYTSAQRRIETIRQLLISSINSEEAVGPGQLRDAFLAPVEIDELNDDIGPRPSENGRRCSDKGFLTMTVASYLELLDWTARQLVPGKRGATPESTPAIFERLDIQPDVWCALVSKFGSLFSLVAGKPETVDNYRSQKRKNRFHLPRETRELLEAR